MKKEELIELGLTEEQANKVVDLHKNTLDNQYIPKTRFDELTAKKNTLKTQVEERDNAIKDLKQNLDNSVDKKKIDEIRQQLSEQDKKYAQQLAENNKKFKIVSKIAQGVHDSELVVGMLDISSITINEQGDIMGLEEQMNNLKTTKSFLFKPETKDGGGAPVVTANANAQAPINNETLISPNLINNTTSPTATSNVVRARDSAIQAMKTRAGLNRTQN